MSQPLEYDLDPLLEFAIKLAKKGGRVLTKYWGRLLHVEHKEATIDLVTVADKESEKAIIHLLKKSMPGHAVLSEEAGGSQIPDADFVWVIDPLDGTTNYTHQFPIFSVSIGLFYKGTPILGVVYNPLLKELFYASKGKGAFLNGKTLSVSKVDTLDRSLLSSGFPYDRKENRDNNYAEFCLLTQFTQGVRRPGSAALDMAYVAAGRFEGYWERGLKIWDIAAGIVLVQEAGGRVSAYDGGPVDLNSGMILASNGLIHQAISEKILQARTFLKAEKR